MAESVRVAVGPAVIGTTIMADAASPVAFDIEGQRARIQRALAPWQVALSGMAAGAAFFGAGAAFIALLGP